MHWMWLPLLVVACEMPDAATTPSRPAVAPAPPTLSGSAAPDGWCARRREPRLQTTRAFEVTEDLRSVKRLRARGFSSEQIAFDRDAHPHGTYTWLAPTIDHGTLRLSTYRRTCHETGAGCFHGYWEEPPRVVLTDPVPTGACITYAMQVGAGMLVGVGAETRSYYGRDDGSTAKGPRVPSAVLEGIDVLDGRTGVLQEPSGGLWTARWESSTAAPVLTKTPGVTGRVRALSHVHHDRVFAFTDDALYALDARTLAPVWRLEGELWSILPVDVPLHYYALEVVRGDKPKLVLHVLDAAGKQQRSRVVYEGAVDGARLGRSFEVGEGATYIVHVAPS